MVGADLLLTNVGRYASVMEIVYSFGPRYRANPASIVWTTHLRETTDILSVFQECAHDDGLRSLVFQRPDLPGSGTE